MKTTKWRGCYIPAAGRKERQPTYRLGRGVDCEETGMKNQFFTPGPMPGLNEIIAASKQIVPWLSKGKVRVYEVTVVKKHWTGLVAACVIAYKVKPVERINLMDLTWMEPTRRRDKDNVAAGKKFIFDGLVAAGIIKNDTARYVGEWSERVVYPGDARFLKPGVLVVIE